MDGTVDLLVELANEHGIVVLRAVLVSEHGTVASLVELEKGHGIVVLLVG